MITSRAQEPAEAPPTDWTDALNKFTAFLADQEKSENTIRCYRQDLEKFGAWHQAQYEEPPLLAAIAAVDLRGWKTSLLQAKAAPQSVNRRLAALQSLLKWGHAREWCNDVQRPRIEREEPPRPRWLSIKEERALIREVEREGVRKDIALIKLLRHAGLRIAEAASLRWGMFEISPRKGTVKVIGKGRKRRVIPLNVEARNALMQLLDGMKPKLEEPVFEGREGGLTENALWRIVVYYGQRSGIDHLSPHVLRHTFCRRLAEKGVRLETIAALAGHESLDTTRRYVEPGEEDLRNAVESMACNLD
jgi:site-specific recombinase XerD